MAKSPENTIRMVVARPNPEGKKDKTLEGAIRFILQQQGQKYIKKADMSVVQGDEHDVNQIMRRIHGSLVAEAKEPDAAELKDVAAKVSNSKEALAQQIAQALNRYSFLDKADDRGMLLLLAALALLNVSDNGDNINGTARRLLAAGLGQMKRKS